MSKPKPKPKQEVLPPLKNGGRPPPPPAPKGNQYAKGNKGPWTHRPVTSAIVAKLNEIDKTTGREYIWRVVDELFEAALSKEIVLRNRRGEPILDAASGKPVLIRVLGDLDALKEIVNRADGKPRQDVSVSGSATIVLHFDREDENA